MNVGYVVIVNVSIACRDFLKVLMLLPVQFNCTVLKVGYSVIVNFSLSMHQIQFLVMQPFLEADCALTAVSLVLTRTISLYLL